MLEECELDSMKWAKQCNVQRQFVHGSPAFAGNACKTLLNRIDSLRAFACIKCLKYVKCFQHFRNVVEACFSLKLNPEYKKYIAEFKRSYCDLNISITPKIHCVFFHVAEFCDKVGKGLGFYSEQAIEAVHADFKSTWAKYKVATSHSEYSKQLLRAVQEYNSKHL